MLRFVSGGAAILTPPHKASAEGSLPMTQHEQLVTDPVCQMKIKPSDAVASLEHDGTTYYFCSQDCADSFRESPEDYV